MLLLYTVIGFLAVVSVQCQQPHHRRDHRVRERGRHDQQRNIATSQGKGFYRERFAGQSFCSTLQHTCCDSRDDDCSVQIGETRCYCDIFCDQGLEYPWSRKAPDCCPDYPQVCQGKQSVAAPEQVITIKRCREDEFTCESDNTCISRRNRCDGYDNCGDGSDESACGQFGITLMPDIIHLEDHAHHITEVDFACEFISKHKLRLQMTTDPPQQSMQPADRYSYFTTGTVQKSLAIRPNIRGIVCEAFDQSGDKVLYARAKVVNGREYNDDIKY